MTDDEERRAFLDAIRDVRPLKESNRVAPKPKRPTPKARSRRAADAAVLVDSLRGHWLEGLQGEVWFARPHLPDRILRRLRSGQYSIEAELDLHGLTRNGARSAVRDFLRECANQHVGCARIIHGKGSRSGPGGPVLKEAVQNWLTQWDEVLGYASAGPRHGGNGAVIVLLRRR
jgi:DNA-nicking Smr family endonuclease